ncbi:MAG: multidrug efflux RND transporter permease subunit [Planctomycetaceae bacterium]|nr:multidrug efflux RND transporter permease subunit [Planctomycetaceae bacterium]
MFSKFFIDRPIFAAVVSIVIVMVGGLCLLLLPVEKTPDITPPTVIVFAVYPGASADVVAETVATPLEEAINGVEGMIYLSSNSSDGRMIMIVTFEVGTDVDMATVMVQNRVAQAEPTLPEEVIRQGVTTRKRSSNITLVLSFFSSDDTMSDTAISNYLNLRVKDVLARVPGVGEVQVFGERDFSMRVWLDPAALNARDLTVDDVTAAIREQNVQVAAGQLASMPNPGEQPFQLTIRTLGRLSDPEQFENIVLRTEPGGRLLRLKDVARVELGAENYDIYSKINGRPAVAMAIYQTPGANALSVASGVYDTMEELAKAFPEGLEYLVPYNPTDYIKEAVREIVITLFFTGGLVVLTMFIFLADWRATLIPAIAIPVSLIGTFSLMAAFGISINTISMFGLVLVIGIVVDDAILVTENVVRLIDEEKLSPRDAAIKGMSQITGPVVATTLVLLSVFIPTVFVGGITAKLFSQFAFTISIAVIFSAINALTLSPALCALLLRPTGEKRSRFFNLFDRTMKGTTSRYTSVVKIILRRSVLAMLGFAALTVLSLTGYSSLSTGFLPDEDEGAVMLVARLPDGASLSRTEQVMAQVESILSKTEGVRDYMTIGGFSLLDMAPSSNGGTVFVRLNPWRERSDPSLHAQAVADRLQQQLLQIPDAMILALLPPSIQGVGMFGGFEVRVQDRGGAGLEALAQVGNDIVFAGQNDPVITRLNSSFRATVPQVYVDVDRVKAKTLDVPLSTIFNTLQTALGSSYINDFNLYGRTFKVIAQAEAPFRLETDDILKLEVRNRAGQMLPLSALVRVEQMAGPQSVSHYNLYPATTITGVSKPGFSSGQAMDRIAELLDKNLPSTMGYEWSGISYQERASGQKTVYIFLLAGLFAYLFMAAQYESWTIPFSIVLVIPLGIFGAVLLTWAMSMDNNIYTQIGIVLLIAIVTKVAILLVEFAKQLHEEGRAIEEAALEAARVRFRPILMTALTTGLGAFPMVIATGAGAMARQSLGNCVFGGVIAATFLGVLLIPVFYVVVQRIKERSISLEKKLEEKMHLHHESA